MDYSSNFSEKKPVSQDPNNPNHNRKPSKSDLLHSAKVLSEAAQSHLRHEPDQKYDKAQLAAATADLLNAAADYGKLDDNKGIGKYVDKAEDYLRQYTSHSPAKPADHNTGEHLAGGGYGGDDGKKGKKHSQGSGGLGSGDFLKMAGDFLKK